MNGPSYTIQIKVLQDGERVAFSGQMDKVSAEDLMPDGAVSFGLLEVAKAIQKRLSRPGLIWQGEPK